MPRRPRPLRRAPPHNLGTPKKNQKKAVPEIKPKAVPKIIHFADADSESQSENGGADNDEEVEELNEDEDESSEQVEFEEGSSQGTGLEEDHGQDDDVDADAPRVAQWEDDEEENFMYKKPIEEKSAMGDGTENLPLGALRRAQRILSQAEPESDSDSEADSERISSNSGSETYNTKGKGKEKGQKVEWSAKPRTDITKRSSKHAPMEVTSKKPVTRRRTVIEVPKIVPRDPRFLPTAGEFSADRFSKSYGFLVENRKRELQTLRETLKQARKLLSSSPKELRSEREHEVYRLEQAIKRTESLVNKDRLDQVQREALSKVKKEERAKRSEGKGAWYLKKGEQRKLIVQAKYEALAKEGGQRAVKKVMEKRQKKQSQKEKRSRPYAKGEEGLSRKRSSDSGWPTAKRQRVV
ncbi:rRNA biogenesis protein RRP36 [Psilocybe cubensis]|uniref:rRNA biogenesis protein RRP36 n=1 Tax=Psilocybe cubensis TaxID=181762 RepID=A0ACB8HH06_PSICU|nr:rRNA biogenesis protein RRP36 [Psilocybe cubensis]KAH9486974.1 rRNA biogenesis protein RRP36 [Psilocybe cubensis]